MNDKRNIKDKSNCRICGDHIEIEGSQYCEHCYHIDCEIDNFAIQKPKVVLSFLLGKVSEILEERKKEVK